MAGFLGSRLSIQVRLFEKPAHHDDAGTKGKNNDAECCHIDEPFVLMDLLHVKSHVYLKSRDW